MRVLFLLTKNENVFHLNILIVSLPNYRLIKEKHLFHSIYIQSLFENLN